MNFDFFCLLWSCLSLWLEPATLSSSVLSSEAVLWYVFKIAVGDNLYHWDSRIEYVVFALTNCVMLHCKEWGTNLLEMICCQVFTVTENKGDKNDLCNLEEQDKWDIEYKVTGITLSFYMGENYFPGGRHVHLNHTSKH